MALPVTITGKLSPEQEKVISKEALEFVSKLHGAFESTRQSLLRRRIVRQFEIDEGKIPDFLPETKHIREDPTWQGPPLAPGLVDRRVEITGPTDRKMVVNALNADVKTYMADLEGNRHFAL